MRHALRVAVLTVLLLIAGSAPAWAIAGWLERLSGPGPFFGLVVPVSFACFGDDRLDNRDGELRLYADYDCLQADDQRFRVVFGAEVGRLWSLENALPYAGDRAGTEPGVRALSLVGTAMIPVTSYLSVGAGLGAIRFSGENDLFPPFWSLNVQPLRLSIRPALLFTEDARWGIIKGYLNLPIFTRGYDAADFGAIGPFREGAELVPQYGIVIDFGELLVRRHRARTR